MACPLTCAASLRCRDPLLLLPANALVATITASASTKLFATWFHFILIPSVRRPAGSKGGWLKVFRRTCVFSIKSYNAHVRVTQKDAGRELVLFAWTRFTWAAKPSVNQSRHPAQILFE